jgi:hypothetical protein
VRSTTADDDLSRLFSGINASAGARLRCPQLPPLARPLDVE